MKEFREELSRLGFQMEHLGVGYEEIQADTLEEVVGQGLKELGERGLDNFIIDDSGLFIDALNGFPGVYSAYALRTLGCGGILKLMEGIESRGAHFKCCIGARIQGVGEIVVCDVAKGEITEEKRDGGGFGFDPIFRPEGEPRTYAEMPLDEKNRISHRGMAIRSFSRKLEERMD